MLLPESLGYEVMCWAEGDAFLAQADLYRTGVVLLDMRMPTLDGQEVHEALRQCGSTPGGGLSDRTWRRPDGGRADETRRGGFSAKPVSLMPLQAALENGLRSPASALYRKKSSIVISGLRPKSGSLLLVVKGLMNREIAQAMNIAVRTVEVHRARVMEKMQAGSLAELVSIYSRLSP